MPNYVVRHSHNSHSGNSGNSVSRYAKLANQIAKAAGRSYRVIHQHMNNKKRKRSSGGEPKVSKKKKTGKKFKLAKGLEISQHNDLSTKKVDCLYRPKKGISSKKWIYQYQVQKSGIIACNSGNQAVSPLFPMGIRPQLNGETSSGAALRSNDLWDTDPFLLNPYSTPPGNAIYTEAVPARGYMASDMIKVHSILNEISLMNMETVPTTVNVYWLMARRSCDGSPLDHMNQFIADENYRQPLEATTDVLTGTTAASGGVRSVNAYNFNPFGLRDFRKYWKTIGSTKFVLQPGDQRNLYWNIHFNKLITKRYIANGSGNTGTNIQGLTVYPVVIARAGMVGVTGGEVATDVTFGPVKLGVITTQKWMFQAVQPARFKVNRIYEGQLVDTENIGTQNLTIIDDVDHAKVIEKA